jgi:hypothetical protein
MRNRLRPLGPAWALSVAGRVGAENSVTSRDLHVLVYETTEAISPRRPNGRVEQWASAACGRMLAETSVRAVSVVILGELLQHQREVAGPGDQGVIEAFAAQGADPALYDRVRLRRSDWCADDPGVGAGEHRVEGGGEPAVPIADQEPKLLGALAEFHE